MTQFTEVQYQFTAPIAAKGKQQRWNKFWGSVHYQLDSKCWEWQGSKYPNGDGQCYMPGMTRYAHKVSYIQCIGEVPEGLDLDHLCRNRLCVNPAHLEPVTRQTNVLRGIGFIPEKARATHCNYGHEYTEINTYRAPNQTRHCKICRRRRCLESYYRTKEG